MRLKFDEFPALRLAPMNAAKVSTMEIKSLNVSLFGATGNLGGRIVEALLARAEKPTVRIAARGSVAGKHHERLREWQSRGIEVVDADLADEASLERACAGADIVISAVQGGPEIIVDGQGRLLQACLKAGVQRLVPSDYSFDMFALDEGENYNSDVRRAFARAVLASGIGHTFFLNGGFMEVMVSPFIGMFDRQAGTLCYWGNGTHAMDFTSMDDAAAYLAATVLDPGTLNRTVEIAGDQLDVPAMAAAYEAGTSQKLRLISKGPIEAGYAELDRLKREGADVKQMLPLMYQLPMVSGKAKLHRVENDHYPEVHATTLATFLKRQAVIGKVPQA
jgi:uncharacterized protein YbjT (DUF2867 family)